MTRAAGLLDGIEPWLWVAKLRGDAGAPGRDYGKPVRTPMRTIYFIGPENGPIKIGVASRLDFRLKDLRMANAYPLEVWATVEGPASLERDYHRRFKATRLHGEWFARTPELLAEIERLNA